MYELTSLFWYKPIFMTELLLAEAMIVVNLKRRRLFLLRVFAALVLCYGIAFAFPLPVYNAAYCSLLFFCLFAVSVGAMALCFRESWKNVLFCAVAGYTVQHVAFQLYDFIVCVSGLSEGDVYNIYGSTTGGVVYAPFAGPFSELAYFFTFIIVYWLGFVLFGRRIKKNEELHIGNVTLLVFLAIFSILNIVLSALVTYYVGVSFDRFYTSMLCLFNVLCCILALYLLFELPKRKLLESELAVMERLYAQSERQYASVKESVELINLKCHDLKHQIRSIVSGKALDSDTIREIEETISIYDATVKTGNATLDVILTEKSLLCHSKNIRFSCIVDGARLDFMRETDIYVFFGNILENAIEAVLELEPNLRDIGVLVRPIRGFLSINVHNCYAGERVLVNGIPQTTKQDKENHGFGMRSIRMICEKYGGELSVEAADGVFNLNAIFPLSEEKA